VTPLLHPASPTLQKCAVGAVIVFVPKTVAMTVRPSELFTISLAPVATPGDPTTLFSVAVVSGHGLDERVYSECPDRR